MDETTYKYLSFEMKKGEVDRKEMLVKLEEMIREKSEEHTRRVEAFETRNWIQYVNQNIMSVIRFFSGPVKFTLGWLDKIDKIIRQHLTSQGMLMKRDMATSPSTRAKDTLVWASIVVLESTSSSLSASSNTSGGPSSVRNGSGG